MKLDNRHGLDQQSPHKFSGGGVGVKFSLTENHGRVFSWERCDLTYV